MAIDDVWVSCARFCKKNNFSFSLDFSRDLKWNFLTLPWIYFGLSVVSYNFFQVFLVVQISLVEFDGVGSVRAQRRGENAFDTQNRFTPKRERRKQFRTPRATTLPLNYIRAHIFKLRKQHITFNYSRTTIRFQFHLISFSCSEPKKGNRVSLIQRKAYLGKLNSYAGEWSQWRP